MNTQNELNKWIAMLVLGITLIAVGWAVNATDEETSGEPATQQAKPTLAIRAPECPRIPLSANGMPRPEVE